MGDFEGLHRCGVPRIWRGQARKECVVFQRYGLGQGAWGERGWDGSDNSLIKHSANRESIGPKLLC